MNLDIDPLPPDIRESINKWKDMVQRHERDKSITVGEMIEELIASGQNIDRKLYEKIWDNEITDVRWVSESSQHIPEILGSSLFDVTVAFSALTQTGEGVDMFAEKFEEFKTTKIGE